MFLPSVSLAVIIAGYVAVAQPSPQNATKELHDLTIRNLRLRIILDSIRAYVNQQTNYPSSEKFDLILDEQVRQANQTAERLHQLYEDERLTGTGDETPKEVAKLVVDTYSQSLLRFLNPTQARQRQITPTTTQRPSANKTEDPIVVSLREYWKAVDQGETIQDPKPDANQNLEKIRSDAVEMQTAIVNDNLQPTFMVPQQGVIPDDLLPFKPLSNKELKDMLKLIITDEFKMLEAAEDSPETRSMDHISITLKINENTTVNQLLTHLGQECLSLILCNAGADPRSMGSFGRWAVQRFDGNQQRTMAYIYPELTSAYLEGQQQIQGDSSLQYCAKRFRKCQFTL